MRQQVAAANLTYTVNPSYSFPGTTTLWGDFSAYTIFNVLYDASLPMYLGGNSADTACAWWMNNAAGWVGAGMVGTPAPWGGVMPPGQ